MIGLTKMANLSNLAPEYISTIVRCVQREYPNAPRHIMQNDADCPTPRHIHPAFYGCFDWHSSVNMHWALVRLLSMLPDAGDRSAAFAVLDQHLNHAAISQEVQYLREHRGFERPYGWGWALMLTHELHAWHDGQRWAEAMRPLANTISDLMVAWLTKAVYPNRDGMHSNTAFGLARSLPWAHYLAEHGDVRLLNAITSAAMRWFKHDRDYPARWEPSGSDFLSPALTEAELMSAILEPPAFQAWFDQFLPDLAQGEPRSLFTVGHVVDESDGQLAHLHGLNLYRAFVFLRLSAILPNHDPRVALFRQAASDHANASLRAVTGSDYMLEHWLASYALLYWSEEYRTENREQRT